jgi:hypothetical protein
MAAPWEREGAARARAACRAVDARVTRRAGRVGHDELCRAERHGHAAGARGDHAHTRAGAALRAAVLAAKPGHRARAGRALGHAPWARRAEL